MKLTNTQKPYRLTHSGQNIKTSFTCENNPLEDNLVIRSNSYQQVNTVKPRYNVLSAEILTGTKLSELIMKHVKAQHYHIQFRDVRFGFQLGQKLDKSGTFKDKCSVHFGSRSKSGTIGQPQ